MREGPCVGGEAPHTDRHNPFKFRALESGRTLLSPSYPKPVGVGGTHVHTPTPGCGSLRRGRGLRSLGSERGSAGLH